MASDPRRHDRVTQYKEKIGESLSSGDHFNALGMLFSLVGLLLKYKLFGWLAVYCGCMLMANSKAHDEKKSVFTLFLLSSSSLIMMYMQSPAPMSLSW